MNNNIMEQYKLYSKSTVGFCNTRSVCMFYWFITFMFYIFPASKKYEKPSRICQVVYLTLFSLTCFVCTWKHCYIFLGQRFWWPHSLSSYLSLQECRFILEKHECKSSIRNWQRNELTDSDTRSKMCALRAELSLTHQVEDFFAVSS